MLNRYEKYLEFLDKKLNGFFEAQKPYIFCKDGCSLCCKNAQFPCSLLEVKYLIKGMFELPVDVRLKIEDKMIDIIAQKRNFKGERFIYDCPFLINNSCAVYKYRGIVCRAFGLLSKKEDGKTKTPFCCFQGLNYSNVYDEQEKTFSGKKMKELGITQEPLVYNIGYSFLTSKTICDKFKLNFGEKKPLIDWFINEKENAD